MDFKEAKCKYVECIHLVQDRKINGCTLFKRKHQEFINKIAVSWLVSKLGYDGEVDIRLTFILLILFCEDANKYSDSIKP
jgi:hypothetical protein